MARRSHYPIVKDESFILATRDTGYKSAASAMAELVDNSVQAGAGVVSIRVWDEGKCPGRDITVTVLDDGCGMDSHSLRVALQLGGSTRFGDRTGLGRFGMGLPNSSLSQCRILEVYTWRSPGRARYCYLDVDEIASGRMREVPKVTCRRLPELVRDQAGRTGTLVKWSRCDRLEYRKASTVAKHLAPTLGRTFRKFLADGLRITVNDVTVEPVDPLFRDRLRTERFKQPFRKALEYEIRVPRDHSCTSSLRVTFSLLPVARWHSLPADVKRRMGIVNGAGVCVVRAKREIDSGWFFLGSKRKENYDDWWRCEVSFEPDLDELFGVTHSKQQVTPTAELESIISGDIEATARRLNTTVRRAFADVRSSVPCRAARVADRTDPYLPPVRVPQKPRRRAVAVGRALPAKGLGRSISYCISSEPFDGPEFFRIDFANGTLGVVINREHPFYSRVYEPARSEPNGREAFNLEVLLLAAARAEAAARTARERSAYQRKRCAWSDALAAFLGA